MSAQDDEAVRKVLVTAAGSLVVYPGDRVLLRYEHRISADLIGKMKASWAKAVPGTTCIILERCAGMEVVRSAVEVSDER